MSDLQCPATVLVLRDARSEQVLAAHRVAAVVAPEPMSSTAERLSALVRAPVVRRNLDEDVVSTLEELADLHRGETLLVLTEGDRADDLLARILGRAAVRRLQQHPQPLVELAVDADGWALRPAP